MKLNLHPKEFLALYNLLEEHKHVDFEDNSLREVYNRMRSYIVASLSLRDEDQTESSMDAWFKVQQKKIAELKEKNEAIKSATKSGKLFEETSETSQSTTGKRKNSGLRSKK